MTVRSRDAAGSRMEPALNCPRPQLTDEQWSLISDLFPVPVPDPHGGRPRADARHCLEGVRWVLRSGARWKDLPRSYPSYVTCWRRFVEWSGDGVSERAWSRLVDQLDREGQVDWDEGFADATFAPSKKGAISSGRPSGAKGPSSWSWSTERAYLWPSTSTAPARPKSR